MVPKKKHAFLSAAPFGFKFEIFLYRRRGLAGKHSLQLAPDDWSARSRVDLFIPSTFAEIKTHLSRRLADKADTSSWRAGKTEKILSNIDLS